MKHTLLSFCFFCCSCCIAQNLVPNGDFEQFDTCQTGAGQLYRVRHWTSPISPLAVSSPDYYNACNSNPLFGVPTNSAGFEYAYSGVAYVAICTGAKSAFNMNGNFREYLQVELLDTLTTGRVYCLQFYVSACDSVNYASNNMGTFFSPEAINNTCGVGGCNLPYVPQFENSLSNSLNSNNGWIKVSGTYTAQGGEKYLVIGNFRDSSSTQMTLTNWTTNMNRSFAVYYVDDVSLTFCDTTTAILDKRIKSAIRIYPNPSNGIFYVELNTDEAVALEIFDAIGNLVYQKKYYKSSDSPIDISNHSNGIYLLKFSKGIDHQQVKIVKQ